METFSFDLPTMYGDHHVQEVRRLLLEIPGVEQVYASSSFQLVEVSYDPTRVKPEEITGRLAEAGYSGELAVPVESGVAAYHGDDDKPAYFRHTQVYEHTRQVVSFAQKVGNSGRPLWPCPGIGPVKFNHTEE